MKNLKTLCCLSFAVIYVFGNIIVSSAYNNMYSSTYKQSCTSKYILNTMYPMGQIHDAIPNGNISDSWKYYSRWENKYRPISYSHNCSDLYIGKCSNSYETKPMEALCAWSNIYRVDGTPFSSNTGVEMKNMKVYGWYNGQWEEVQNIAVPKGNFYAENFGGDANRNFNNSMKMTNISKTIILRENDKVTYWDWNNYSLKNENSMYHLFTEPKKFDTKYEYVYTCVDLRKVKYDEYGIDDIDSTRYCANVSGDWWREEGLYWHSSWQHNVGIAQPKFVEITKQWKRFSMTTVPENWQYGFPQ